MYGIIEFFKRNYFLLLFAALEFLSLSFVFRNNYYHEAGFFNSANSVAGSVYKIQSGITYYFNLSEINRQLAEENAEMHNVLSKANDTSGMRKFKTTNRYGQQFNYVLGEVIDNSTNRTENYITLDVGRKQGVSNGMGVISPTGIVGIVVNVSDNYSVVMSLLHKSSQISAMLKKDGTFGTLHWKGDDYRYATLSQIPMSEKLKVGDTIVTSGFSSIFPKGITIGNLESSETIPEQYFYSIIVKLSTNFKNLRYVYVVSNIMKEEKTELEQSTLNTYKEK
jgi:rod shape-determining protein MreC